MHVSWCSLESNNKYGMCWSNETTRKKPFSWKGNQVFLAWWWYLCLLSLTLSFVNWEGLAVCLAIGFNLGFVILHRACCHNVFVANTTCEKYPGKPNSWTLRYTQCAQLLWCAFCHNKHTSEFGGVRLQGNAYIRVKYWFLDIFKPYSVKVHCWLPHMLKICHYGPSHDYHFRWDLSIIQHARFSRS